MNPVLQLLTQAETARRQLGVPLSAAAAVWRIVAANAPEPEAAPYREALAVLEKSDSPTWLATYCRSLNK